MRNDGINRETDSIVSIHRALPWEKGTPRGEKKNEMLNLDNVQFEAKQEACLYANVFIRNANQLSLYNHRRAIRETDCDRINEHSCPIRADPK